MKTLSLKLDDAIFEETERMTVRLKKPRNRYINEALDFYNKYQNRRDLAYRLKQESGMVAEESMNVLGEFDSITDEPETV